MKLVSVHVITRHGDRLHLNQLPDNSIIPIRCELKEDLKFSSALAREYDDAMQGYATNGGRQPNQTFYGMDLHPMQEWCNLGHLTPVGAVQHLVTGNHLREAYLDGHHLLSLQNPHDEVLVKSTKYSRNFQSAMALMHGFLPEVPPSKLKIEKVNNVSFCGEHSGHPCSCEAADKFKDIFPARHKQLSANLRGQTMVKPVYQHMAEVFGVTEDAILPPSHNMDIYMVHMCHQTMLKGPTGQCLQPWAVKDLYDALSLNGHRALTDKRYLRAVKLKMQPLLYEMAERMIKQTAKLTQIKFVLYSGHDTTIEPLAAALGFSSGIWARYAARIVIELYHKVTTRDKFYLRVLYNGTPVTHLMPFCRTISKIETVGLCPLREFVNFAKIGNIQDLGATDYGEACSIEIDSDPL